MYLAQIFTSKMFLWDISLIFANVHLIGTQFIVRLYEPLLNFSSQKCTMKKKKTNRIFQNFKFFNNDFTIAYTYIQGETHKMLQSDSTQTIDHIQKCFRQQFQCSRRPSYWTTLFFFIGGGTEATSRLTPLF